MTFSFRKFWFLVLLMSLVLIWGCAQKETQEKPWTYSMLDMTEAKLRQQEVDTGHRASLLDPHQVAYEFLESELKILGNEVKKLDDKNLKNQDIIVQAFLEDGRSIDLYLVQPVRKDSTGIWCVNRYRVFPAKSKLKESRALKITGLTKEDIPFAYSPDKKTLFVMDYGDEINNLNVITGDYTRKVNIYKISLSNGQRTMIAQGIPFISLAKISPDEKYLALMGGGELRLLQLSSGKLTDNIGGPPALTHFGWSPDGKKIYTEHESFPNDMIYFVESGQKRLPYEPGPKEPFYKASYKIAPGKEVFVGTDMAADKYGNKVPITVIFDKNQNIKRTLSIGRVRDVFKNNIIQVGKERFELLFIPNYETNRQKILSEDYIYQCAFTPDGDVIYTTKGKIKENPCYSLNLFDPKNNRQKTVEVSGPHFCLWPDGRYIDICGYKEERLSLPDLKMVKHKDRNLYTGEKARIISTLHQASDAYFKNYYKKTDPKELEKELKKYFVNTSYPVPQEALFDVHRELIHQSSSGPHRYHIFGTLESLKINGSRASVKAGFVTESDYGSWSFISAFETVKINNNWYITGLATFPESGEREKVVAVVQKFIDRTEKGKRFYFQDEKSNVLYKKIMKKKIKMGQVQFWSLGDPNLASNVGSAVYTKVYLDVEDKRYKLLVKKNTSWNIERLDDERLWHLF